jgi:P4 family phage/plasmid primase-like protien
MKPTSIISGDETNKNNDCEQIDSDWHVELDDSEATGDECPVESVGAPTEEISWANLQVDYEQATAGTQEAFLENLSLSEAHREHLRTSGLNDEMIARAGLKSVTAEQAYLLGFRKLSGMVIPYPGRDGHIRLRPDAPPVDEHGREAKYLSVAGAGVRLYVPPGVERVLRERNKPLIITEGEKKALKATQEGFPTVGLSGVDCWRAKDQGVIQDLKAIKWKHRPTYIAFDSDILDKSEVQAALRGLVEWLESCGAEVRIVILPSGLNGEKVGLDDYLMQRSAADLQRLVDDAPHLLDAALGFVQPGLDPKQLQTRLDDVYRAVKMYPASARGYAGRIRERLSKYGYMPSPVGEIERAIKRAKPFVSPQLLEKAEAEAAPEEMDARQAAEAMLAECYADLDTKQLTLRYYRGSFYQWIRTRYEEVRELAPTVMRWLQSRQQRCTASFVQDVIANLQGMTHLNTAEEPPFKILDTSDLKGTLVNHEWVISFENTVVPVEDLAHGTLWQENHSPAMFNLVSLPYRHDPGATCPKWIAFLDEILDEDAERIKLLQEMFGYCLWNKLDFQKFFILQGEGANGKSVVLNVLTAMLGEDNVSHLSLDQIGNRFSPAAMEGKLANIYTDLEEIEKLDEGLLKTLTAGEAIQAERKFKEPWSMRPTAKLIFSANTLPVLRDRSQGIWRRLVVIPFEVTIPEGKQDKQLSEKLEQELPGIFNWAISGLMRLLERGQFTGSAKCEAAKTEHRHSSDHVLAFLEECILDDPQGAVGTGLLYQHYKEWVEGHGYKLLSDANFGKALRRHRPHVSRRDKQIVGPSAVGGPQSRKKVREYAGIKLA